MPRERPPKGYDRDDFSLPHRMEYSFGLDFGDETKNSTMLTYLRTTKDSVNPESIEVHPKNTNFAVDGGAVICYDSIVNQIMISKKFVFTKHAHVTDTIPKINVKTMKIIGSREDSWTPADELTGTDTATILLVTDDTTKEDVTPTFSGVDLTNAAAQPLSTVTMAEAYTDYNLTTNANLESIAFGTNLLFTAEHYYTNGGKVKSLHRPLKGFTLSQNKRYQTIFEKRFVPQRVRRAVESSIFSEIIHMDIDAAFQSAHDPSHVATAGNHIWCTIMVQFNEWNKKFEQARMG